MQFFNHALTSNILVTFQECWCPLTHWGRVTHICVSKLSIIGSDNGLSHGWHNAIIWTNAGILFIWHLGSNLSDILIEIHTFSFKKCIWKYRLEIGGHLSRLQRVKPTSAGPAHKWDQNFVTADTADLLAPTGARLSTGTVLTTILTAFSSSFHFL